VRKRGKLWALPRNDLFQPLWLEIPLLLEASYLLISLLLLDHLCLEDEVVEVAAGEDTLVVEEVAVADYFGDAVD